MPYKFIGRTLDHKGKTLWEILGNLKNFGVGRIIARNMFERYPEPSFMKIVRAEAHDNPENPSMDDRRKVKVWVERTFRGRKYPEILIIETASYKADYKLIPKDEEEAYCKKVDIKPIRILPRTVELPPLLKELVIRENIENGDPPEKDNEVEIVYNIKVLSNFRAAVEGEKPDMEITMGLGTPASPNLYKGLGLELSK